MQNKLFQTLSTVTIFIFFPASDNFSSLLITFANGLDPDHIDLYYPLVNLKEFSKTIVKKTSMTQKQYEHFPTILIND